MNTVQTKKQKNMFKAAIFLFLFVSLYSAFYTLYSPYLISAQTVRLGAPQPIERSTYQGIPIGGRSTYQGVPVGGGIVRITNPLGHIANDIPGLISYIVNVAKWLAGVIAILAIIFGAYQILFAAGDPEAFKKGRMTIVYAIIGLALVLIADIIVDIVNEIVGY